MKIQRYFIVIMSVRLDHTKKMSLKTTNLIFHCHLKNLHFVEGMQSQGENISGPAFVANNEWMQLYKSPQLPMIIILGPTNIALGKSVISDEDNPSKGLAVDGFTWGECVYISKVVTPYIMVDLVEFFYVNQIVIYTPKTCCGELE